MKILITGGAGFIGTNLIKKLVNKNNVVSLDNYVIGTKKNHIKGATYIEGDILDIDKILKNDFDMCYHLAALSRIQPSFKNPYNTFKVNAEGVQHILDWAIKNSTKVIYSGSSSRHHNPHNSPYALYKFLGEEICKMYRKNFNIDIEIARFYNVYGPNEVLDGTWAAVIGLWRKQIKNDEKLTIIGDGNQKRDFTHIEDIVDGLIKIGFSEEKNKDAWEMGTGVNYSINEVYQMFKNKFNIDCVYLPEQKGNYRETLRENNEMVEKLGWKPKDRLKEYIKNL